MAVVPVSTQERQSLVVASEVAFFAPFSLVPLTIELAKTHSVPFLEIANSVYLTVLLAAVTAYFRRGLPYSRTFLLFVLSFGALGSIWTSLLWNSELTSRAMLAAMDTNNSEAMEFLFERTQLSLSTLASVAGIVTVPLLALIFQIRHNAFWAPKASTVLMCVMLLPVVPLMKMAHDFTVPNFGDWKYLGVTVAASEFPPVKLYLTFAQALKMRQELVSIGSRSGPVEGARRLDAEELRRPRTYVVAIGESLTKHRMALYGYGRDTTPRLVELSRSGDLAVFTDVVAAEDMTLPTLAAALVLETDNAKAPKSVIDLFNSVGFKTYWISNQHKHGSFFDMALSRMVQSASTQIWLNPEMRMTADNLQQKYDGEIVDNLKAIVQESGDKVIFLHLIGSHIAYKYRYPKQFDELAKFANTSCLEKQEIEIYQQYDNSVRYNDEIVSGIIDTVRQAGGDAFVLYFSDHGDEVYDFRKYFGHGGVSISPYIAEVPFMLWLSPEFRRRRSGLTTSLLDGGVIARSYSTRDLSFTLADLAGVTYAGMDTTRSLISPDFKFRERRIASQNYDEIRAGWKKDVAHAGGFPLVGCPSLAVQ